MPTTPYSVGGGGGGAPSSVSAGGSGTKPDDLPLPPYGPSVSSKLVNRRGGAGADDGMGVDNGKMDQRLSTARVPGPSKSLLVRSQTGDFDHNRWLFETKGTYGIGNAYWPQDSNVYANDEGSGPVKMEDLVDKPWKPLSRKVMIKNPHYDVVRGDVGSHPYLDFTGVDVRIPMFVYLSREKRPGYDHNKKAGATNAMVRASVILSNGPFMLNFDCDHCIYNCMAIHEGMCYMLDRGGDRICYIQFPQRFEGIDPSDRYANHNTVFFDGNMRALDGLQGPMYVGTGCLFRRYAVYAFNPPRTNEYRGIYGQVKVPIEPHRHSGPGPGAAAEELHPLSEHPDHEAPQRFGKSKMFIETIVVAEYQGRPLQDHPSVQNGRPPGALLMPRPPLDAATVAESVAVISCWYEDGTEWGLRVGWIYGSVTEDVVTGYRMPNRGWRSVHCITMRDAFCRTAPINLTDRLHQVLRWATGSLEIFFSKSNALLASQRLKFLQRLSYLNVGIYPFTSLFLIMYCLWPAGVLWPVHRGDIGPNIPVLPPAHHHHADAVVPAGGEVVWYRPGGVVAQRAILGDRRHVGAPGGRAARLAEDDRGHRDLLHADGQGDGGGRR